MKITIVGNGVWGNALYSVATKNNNTITLAKRNEKIYADAVVFSTPTQSIRDVIPLITFIGNQQILINTSKGIEKTTHKFPYQIVQELCGESVEYFTLMGPSFAEEVSKEMPTLVNLGYTEKSAKTMPLVQSFFETPYFKVRPTKGVIALELAGPLKNIYAIACGIADGLGYQTNTKVQLIVLAIEELKKLYAAMHISMDESINPELIGDLILTCSSGSRNYNFGKYLAHYSTEKALEIIASTVEGYNTINSLEFLQEKALITLPVASFVKKIITNNNPQEVKTYFLALLQEEYLLK